MVDGRFPAVPLCPFYCMKTSARLSKPLSVLLAHKRIRRIEQYIRATLVFVEIPLSHNNTIATLSLETIFTWAGLFNVASSSFIKTSFVHFNSPVERHWWIICISLKGKFRLALFILIHSVNTCRTYLICSWFGSEDLQSSILKLGTVFYTACS